MKLILFVTEAGIALLEENGAVVKSVKYAEDAAKSYDDVLNGNQTAELNL